MKKIILRQRAEEDLEEIWRFIAIERHNFSAANQLIEDFEEGFHLLASLPYSGPARAEYGTDIRLLTVRKYNLFYQITPLAVEILRILHGARDVPTEIDS